MKTQRWWIFFVLQDKASQEVAWPYCYHCYASGNFALAEPNYFFVT
jgi:hypothetical protein